MNRIIILKIVSMLLLVTTTVTAQPKNKRSNDQATALQELGRLGKWNSQWPVQISLHIAHHVTPTVSESDSTDTDMILYYDPHAFYMQAEGMEQIANDSVLVMVNNAARIIKVFPNNGLMVNQQENKLTSFIPDTSLEKLSQRFIATIREEGRSGKRILLQSHDQINGTELEKEVIDVLYNAKNYQPLKYQQIRRSVVPVDSTVYNELVKDMAWKGRLITTTVNAVQLFLVVKEQVTECNFVRINYEQKASPVQANDRVVKTAGGDYQPAKGYELYNISHE